MKKKVIAVSLIVSCVAIIAVIVIIAQNNSSKVTNDGEVDESLVTVSTPYADLKVTKILLSSQAKRVTIYFL